MCVGEGQFADSLCPLPHDTFLPLCVPDLCGRISRPAAGFCLRHRCPASARWEAGEARLLADTSTKGARPAWLPASAGSSLELLATRLPLGPAHWDRDGGVRVWGCFPDGAGDMLWNHQSAHLRKCKRHHRNSHSSRRCLQATQCGLAPCCSCRREVSLA